jgi:cytochrome c peroxidase
LANDSEAMLIELPAKFGSMGPVTVQLDMNVARILEGIDIATDGTSTHSREGDPLAKRLMRNVAKAVSVRGVRNGLFQKPATARTGEEGTDGPANFPARTSPYDLTVSQRFPKLSLPVDNPLTVEGVTLGESLFTEKRLSRDNSQSCASCHLQSAAFSDSNRFSAGVTGEMGTRQAMPLFNLAWASDFFWDGRAKSLREQALEPIQAAHEMNETLERVVAKLESDAVYRAQFEKAFGSPGISADRIGLAFEQFLLTLVSQNAKFDRAVRKEEEFTEQEKRGFQLFVMEFDPARGLRGADCFHCHGGTLFTNHRYFDNGLDLEPNDSGRMAVTSDPADRGKFKTPSLRNVALTAPYMHDGRFKTLDEVVDHYSTGVVQSANLDPNIAKHPREGIQLTTEEKAALVAFLRTLTDEAFVLP